MKTNFNYKKFADENKNLLVDSFVSLANKYMEGKSNTQEYIDANKQFNEDFMKECVSAIPNTEFTSLEMIKEPMIHNDIFMQHRFNTILAQMITPVVPQVISGGFENLYDVSQVGWGVA